MPNRFYLISFDLKNSKYRQADHPRARASLMFLVNPSNYYRITLQCAIVRVVENRVDAARIRDTLSQILESNCNMCLQAD